MANFYRDNNDIQFLFRHIDLGESAEYCEAGFQFANEFDSAPANAEEAVVNYDMVLDSMGQLCGDFIAPRAEDVDALERRIDALEREVEPLRRFVLPGGCEAAAAFHVARTVCRRAERRVVRLHREEPLAAVPLCYLNRLSDLLFVMARAENRRAGVPDRGWGGPDTD